MNTNINFPHLHIYLDHVGQSIQVFGISIAYYGIVIAIGMILAVMLVLHEARRTGQSEDNYLDLCIYTIIFAIIGARLYYVIFSWDLYKENLLQILNLRQGGLAIYGGVIAGIVTAFIVCRIKKMPFTLVADTAILGLPVGQILGRWGNFFNREAFGQYTDSLFAMQIPVDAVRSSGDITAQMMDHLQVIDGISYIQVHPTFLYESMWNIMVLLVLLYLRKHKKFQGQIFLTYLFGYGIGRFWIESLRTDQLRIGNTGIPVSMLLASVLVVVSAIFIARGLRMGRKQVKLQQEK